ncbi:MAG: putative porin [Hoylesella enoeca]|uniref:putative porin n=1 Tax=Hoylesella enoeca TaxID=76123 RepID=UPI003F9ECE08
MKKTLTLVLFSLMVFHTAIKAQSDFNQIDNGGQITTSDQRRKTTDSLGSDKEIPVGIKVWTVDTRFGDRKPAQVDTLSHMFMNTIFTSGLRGEYNTTGNLGSPRINRIFIDRRESGHFIFTQPYSYFITPTDAFLFTNTLSPFTNISYNNCGDRTNGEDHFTAKFGVNAGQRVGAGFKFDYLYGRGYYQSQSTSHFNYSMYGYYLGDRYQAQILLSTNHQKVAENGGITNDNYITHPESFNEDFQTSEIPTVLSQNWNRNDNQHIFFTQRYNLGFNRKVKMTEEEIKAKKFAIEAQKDQEKRKNREQAEKEAKRKGEVFDSKNFAEKKTFTGRPTGAAIAGTEPADSIDRKGNRISVKGKAAADSILTAQKKQQEDTLWLKDEYVPVTSFIHTLNLDNYRRIYTAYATPSNFYLNTYRNVSRFSGDSLYDKTNHYRIQNTFAISLLEGFNKWAKAGLKAFVTSDFRHFTLPDTIQGTAAYNEHNLSIGGQLSKTEGRTLHYNLLGETWLTGEDAGQLKIEATVDVNFPLFGDTVTLAASGFLHRLNPTFYYRHYHARHYWWDNGDLSNIIHSRVEGLFSYRKTRTTLRVAVDGIKNYTYFSGAYTITSTFGRTGNVVTPLQSGDMISLITASLGQDFTFGPLNWENLITYQKSTKSDILPVPQINVYTNLYLRFKIARVLHCDFGADMRFFTKYYAPDYSPALGQFVTQTGDNKTEVGSYPIVDVYANFHLKRTRFFVMMSHVNAGMGSQNYFLTPHYPLNDRVFRFGLSWNFFN